MSDQKHPVIMCDGDDGFCEAFEIDHTLGGLLRIISSDSQLPPGWIGALPGTGGEHLCPVCQLREQEKSHE